MTVYETRKQNLHCKTMQGIIYNKQLWSSTATSNVSEGPVYCLAIACVLSGNHLLRTIRRTQELTRPVVKGKVVLSATPVRS